MTELSKTARASQVKEAPKEVRIETEEEAIRQIRLNLEAKLYITPDRIAKLLAAYDREKAAVAALAPATSGLLKRAEAAEEVQSRAKKSMVELFPTLKVLLEDPNFKVPEGYRLDFEEINRFAKSLGFQEPIVTPGVHDEVFISEGAIQLKDPAFDHPHEDEHHMVDFGHNTTHPTDAGA